MPHPSVQVPGQRRAESDEEVRLVRAAAEPLPAIDTEPFAALFDRFAFARVVLIGEATQADWPDAARRDDYARDRAAMPTAEQAFARFPTWMWRNREVTDFLEWLMRHERRLERAIGVIYRPETERWSHYFAADLPRQFDAWLWFERTTAVTPLPAARPHGAPGTYPFGV